MAKRWLTAFYRLTIVISAGVLLGEGCIGPNDLRSGILQSVNSLVYRAIEVYLANLFGLPPAA